VGPVHRWVPRSWLWGGWFRVGTWAGGRGGGSPHGPLQSESHWAGAGILCWAKRVWREQPGVRRSEGGQPSDVQRAEEAPVIWAVAAVEARADPRRPEGPPSRECGHAPPWTGRHVRRCRWEHAAPSPSPSCGPLAVAPVAG
jgi:hypothetical protein